MKKKMILFFLGSERSHSMRKVYYKGAVGAFVMFDISKQCTLERAVGWKKEIDLNCFVGDEKVPLPVVLLANKVRFFLFLIFFCF